MRKQLNTLTSSPEASPAKTSHRQAKGKGLQKVRAQASGLNTSGLFATYVRNTSSLRMLKGCSRKGLTGCVQGWPRSGMMRNGRCYRRLSSVPRISGKGFSLLPTPTVTGVASRLGSLLRSPENWETTSNLTAKLIGMEYGLTGRDQYPQSWHYPAPEFIEWMMGVPMRWTDSNASETVSHLNNLSTLES